MSSSAPEVGGEVRGTAEVESHGDDQIDDNTSTTKVETNVIGSDLEGSAPSPEPAAASTQSESEMHLAIALPDLALHSPSTQILGTPFATDSSRFEYPFPDTSPAADIPSTASSSLILTSAFPSLSAGSQQSLTAVSPPTLSSYQPTLPPPLELHNYTPTHPKMKTGSPPVPPGLAKKRQRWSLGLLRRRSSSHGSQSSEGSTRSAPGPMSPWDSSNRVPSGGSLQSSSQTVPEEAISPPPPT
ncbi:hypothetical protein Hypma_008503 [Hypsizygus marmoreus]|uniref:Uncharacterized protein n=1 Tax=Hypsizygus marmoreus TaxID=39966 RepID=A0A369JQ51_HYPMA|nr:hypothetical protein Hypma_008503 [Hypsizygus marmoreus]